VKAILIYLRFVSVDNKLNLGMRNCWLLRRTVVLCIFNCSSSVQVAQLDSTQQNADL